MSYNDLYIHCPNESWVKQTKYLKPPASYSKLVSGFKPEQKKTNINIYPWRVKMAHLGKEWLLVVLDGD